MRTMYDSVNPSAIPRDAEMILWYNDGIWAWTAAERAMFPRATMVSCSAVGARQAQVYDVEPGCIWPIENVGPLVKRDWDQGLLPTVYLNRRNHWQAARDYFRLVTGLDREAGGGGIGAQDLREAEVGNLHTALAVHEHVLRLDVAVHHALVVGILERITNLRDDLEGFAGREPAGSPRQGEGSGRTRGGSRSSREGPGMSGATPPRLVSQFESCTLPKEEWTHQAHLTVGLWYASRLPYQEALVAVREGILRLNAAHGVPTTPTLPDGLTRAAARAPGSMTPTTGMPSDARSAGNATDEAVLQATTSSFTSWEVRNAAFRSE